MALPPSCCKAFPITGVVAAVSKAEKFKSPKSRKLAKSSSGFETIGDQVREVGLFITRCRDSKSPFARADAGERKSCQGVGKY